MRILNFGSLNIDHVYAVEHFVQAGETMSSTGYAQQVGGKGLNQSIALARAGGQVYHAGCVGADGAFLKAYLADNGVDTSLLRVVDGPTGHAIIQVNGRGENCILVHAGANHQITADVVTAALARFGAGDMLLLQNEINDIGAILSQAKRHGLTTALNPSPISESLLALEFSDADWLILNEVEGDSLAGEADPHRMPDALEHRFPRAHILLTLGAHGSVYLHEGKRIHQPAYRVEAVDTTAAGDTFTGFFLASLARTADIAQSMDIAARAAAITVTRPGAAESIPCMGDLA